MPAISIVLLNRDPAVGMADALAALPRTPNSEVMYVTPADVDDVSSALLDDNVRRVEYPRSMPPNTDAVLAATMSSGDMVICSDTVSHFRSWEINSISQALSGTPDVVLKLHRPNGRETDNIADLASLALNAMLGQPHLAAASLLRFPYGLRRSVLGRVSADQLRQPPMFLTSCVLAGLSVDTFYREPEPDPMRLDARELVRVHLGAIDALVASNGARGGFTDFGRRRRGWQASVRGGGGQ